jgi:hypothetical protein
MKNKTIYFALLCFALLFIMAIFAKYYNNMDMKLIIESKEWSSDISYYNFYPKPEDPLSPINKISFYSKTKFNSNYEYFINSTIRIDIPGYPSGARIDIIEYGKWQLKDGYLSKKSPVVKFSTSIMNNKLTHEKIKLVEDMYRSLNMQTYKINYVYSRFLLLTGINKNSYILY